MKGNKKNLQKINEIVCYNKILGMMNSVKQGSRIQNEHAKPEASLYTIMNMLGKISMKQSHSQ
jgi:hypothetical protein